MTHSFVIDTSCVKYYPDPTWQWGVMARARISRMCALWSWPWGYDLGSKSWHTLGLWTTLVWNIIKIQLDSEELCPDTDFQYVCTVTLTSEIWPWVKIMTHPWDMDNNCVKYYPDPTWQWGVMVRTRISSMCALWPWPLRYDLGSRSWHTLGSWATIVWNYIQMGQGSTKLWPGHKVNRRTDGRTDRQSERVIPIYPQTLFAGVLQTHVSTHEAIRCCRRTARWGRTAGEEVINSLEDEKRRLIIGVDFKIHKLWNKFKSFRQLQCSKASPTLFKRTYQDSCKL